MPVDFTPAIIAGVQSLALGMGAAVRQHKEVHDAFLAYGKRLLKIDEDLKADPPISKEDAKDRAAAARAVLKSTIASSEGVAQAQIAKAVNNAAKAFVEVAKTALTSFPL